MGPQERTIFIAFGFVAAFIAFILVYFFLNILRQHRLYRKLQLDKLHSSKVQSKNLD
jgi:hypothetical protein